MRARGVRSLWLQESRPRTAFATHHSPPFSSPHASFLTEVPCTLRERPAGAYNARHDLRETVAGERAYVYTATAPQPQPAPIRRASAKQPEQATGALAPAYVHPAYGSGGVSPRAIPRAGRRAVAGGHHAGRRTDCLQRGRPGACLAAIRAAAVGALPAIGLAHPAHGPHRHDRHRGGATAATLAGGPLDGGRAGGAAWVDHSHPREQWRRDQLPAAAAAGRE